MAESENRKLYTVSQLNQETALLLARHFMTIWVEGEISNLSMPASGHLYFSLKDTNAQIRCALFKNQQRRMPFKPANGMHVLAKAQVSLYEPRGDYQLIVEQMEQAGDGALRLAFENLKRKLAAEGLFDEHQKKPIPSLPKQIGIITSPSGAAIRDILTVLKRRFTGIPIIIYPAAVQGENAKYEIAQALALANQHNQCDVLILARGGGSLEDLWAFNEEIVARAIYASDIPVISGVGHETDITIADFAADFRAATPTAAAEHATPDQLIWLAAFRQLESRLQQQFQRQIQRKQQTLDWTNKRLQQQHPGQKLARNRLKIQDLEGRLNRGFRVLLERRRHTLSIQNHKLAQCNPALRLNQYGLTRQYLHERLLAAMRRRLDQAGQRLGNAQQALNTVSPLSTLSRGYALAIHQPSGTVIRTSRQISTGDRVLTKLGSGEFTSIVQDIDNE